MKSSLKPSRVKKLFCYNFLTEEDIAANPLKILFLSDCLGMYDWAMASKFFLDKGVSGRAFLRARTPSLHTFLSLPDVRLHRKELGIGEALQVRGEH